MFESGEDDTAELNLLKVRKFATKCPLNPDGVQFKMYYLTYVRHNVQFHQQPSGGV